jgi:cyclopropane fatty-acyl-phospholipid synthase-like methyltransferase
LELACGTGGVLKHLAKHYKVNGLDISREMLAVAKKELPKAKLYHQSMVDFKLTEKYDVIICIFDSINHLIKFSGWKKVFLQTQKHLTENGVFIFDINTQKKLDRVIAEPALVRKFDNNLMIMNVTNIGKNISNWNIKIFEQKKGNQYQLQEENIPEVSFPKEQILEALRPLFKSVQVVDTDKTHPKKKGERFYFICKK